MEENREVFELRFPVQESDIDELGHVNNVAYVRWIQDIAIGHWRHSAPPADQAALNWVVLRHEIDYKQAALLGDEVIARTWVGVAKGLRFERNTEILRARDGALLVKGRTLWCPINSQTGRPTPPSAEVRAKFSVGELRVE